MSVLVKYFKVLLILFLISNTTLAWSGEITSTCLLYKSIEDYKNSSSLAKLDKGVYVTVIKVKGRLYFLETINGERGYVKKRFVRKISRLLPPLHPLSKEDSVRCKKNLDAVEKRLNKRFRGESVSTEGIQ